MSTTAVETTKVQTNVKKDYSQYGFANLEPYVHPPETKVDLPWSELVKLDLEDYARPGGKERLAKQLEHAVHHVGFFYVKNFGLTQDQIDQQFTLAKHFFELPISEKEKYEINYAEADYNGWRRPGRSLVASARDNIEIFNIPKFIDDFKGKYSYPDLLKAHIDEIEVFQRALHANVVLPLLRLFAIVLQLPDEDYLVKQHTYEKKVRRSLPLHALLPPNRRGILSDDGNWTWVQAQPGTITVNLADTISHLTGGWLKSSVHRVVAPPQDQRELKRTGLLYFARPHNDTKLLPITDSPVLEEEGVKPRFDKIVTMEEWVKAKQTLQLNPEIAAKRWAERGDGKVEVLAGFHDQKYKE
ncbi:hypothetical protein PMIN04_001208 [Paraphaeosphaeria minitans]